MTIREENLIEDLILNASGNVGNGTLDCIIANAKDPNAVCDILANFRAKWNSIGDGEAEATTPEEDAELDVLLESTVRAIEAIS